MTGDLAAHARLSYGVAYHPAIFIPVLSVNLTRNSPFFVKKKKISLPQACCRTPGGNVEVFIKVLQSRIELTPNVALHLLNY